MKKIHIRKLFLIGAVLLGIIGGLAPVRADMLYMKNGDEYKGNLIKMTPNSVLFKVENTEQAKEFPKLDIVKIELEHLREGGGITKLAELKDELLSASIQKAAAAEANYPDAICLLLYEKVTITVQPDLSCTETRRTIAKVLQDAGMEVAANHIISYLAQDESVNVDFARSIDPAGNIFNIADAAIEDGSVYSEVPEYENLHKKKFAIPEAKPGTVVDYQITRHKKQINTLTPFLIDESFRDQNPLLQKVVTVIAPKDLALSAMVLRGDKQISAEVEEDAGRGIKTYIWRAANAPPINDEPLMPQYVDIAPRLVVSVPNNWSDIGKAYLKFLADNLKSDSQLDEKIKSLIADKTDDEARVRALYNYVIREIRYVPVSPPEYSYLPKPLSRIFNNKFGNNLDKAYLLYGMLKAAGLEPYWLWIRPQSNGEFTPDVISLGQWVTPLIVVNINNQLRYLEPSTDVIPFDCLRGSCQGVAGLMLGPNKIAIVKTPLYPAEKEAELSKFQVALNAEGALVVTKQVDLTGNEDINLRQIKDLKPDELTKQFQEVVNRIHPNARLIEYQLSNLKDLNEPAHLTLKYEIPDYALKAGKELLVFKLPEIDYTAEDVGKETREFPMRWDAKLLEKNDMTITLPEGYKVSYLPKGVSFNNPAVSYLAELSAQGNSISFNDAYRQEEIFLPVDKYADFKKCAETKASFAKEWIVMEKSGKE